MALKIKVKASSQKEVNKSRHAHVKQKMTVSKTILFNEEGKDLCSQDQLRASNCINFEVYLLLCVYANCARRE